jgi:hypothetical protein
MKKIILSLALWAAISVSAMAQVSGNAIGVRGGIGSELSYQHKLSGGTRMEFDFGWYFNHGLNVAAVHHWVFDLSELSNGFNWYVGVGPQVGLWTYDNEGLAVGVAGQIGLEYNFNIPLQLSLDYRPGFYLVPAGHGGAWEGAALGIRYRF